MRRSAPARVLVLEKTMVARKVVVNTAASTEARTVAAKRVASRTVGSSVAKVLEKMAKDLLAKAKARAPPTAAGHAEAQTFLISVPRTVEIKGQQKCGIRSLRGLQTAPIDSDIFSVFRRVGTKYVANISRVVFGKESFYPIVSKVSEKPVKGKMRGKMCCNRFECLGEEIDDFGLGNPSLNVNVERAF